MELLYWINNSSTSSWSPSKQGLWGFIYCCSTQHIMWNILVTWWILFNWCLNEWTSPRSLKTVLAIDIHLLNIYWITEYHHNLLKPLLLNYVSFFFVSHASQTSYFSPFAIRIHSTINVMFLTALLPSRLNSFKSFNLWF